MRLVIGSLNISVLGTASASSKVSSGSDTPDRTLLDTRFVSSSSVRGLQATLHAGSYRRFGLLIGRHTVRIKGFRLPDSPVERLKTSLP